MTLLRLVVVLLGVSLAAAAPLPASAAAQGIDISTTLQNILENTDGSSAYGYPTDLTRGIVPKPIHSHNDYWRDIPFYTALSVGCISTEADVWLYPELNNTLFVGHERQALTPARTLQSLYIDPILALLTAQNPTSQFTDGYSSSTPNGVFDTAGSQTLYLFIDVKTAGESTWPIVVEALEPLRAGGYLTTYNASNTTKPVTLGPVTVIGTGNTPLDQVQNQTYRDYFYDAPLPLLGTTFSNITAEVSPIASTDFAAVFGTINGTEFNSTQLATLRSQLAIAKSKGILGRYWDQPAWPIATRDAIWATLVQEGVGLVNADDVFEAAGFGGINGFWG